MVVSSLRRLDFRSAMRTRLSHCVHWLLALTLALAACGQRANTPAPTGSFVDTTARCPWTQGVASARASLPGFTMRCGLVSVPEFHAQPSGPRLSLAVLLAQ